MASDIVKGLMRLAPAQAHKTVPVTPIEAEHLATLRIDCPRGGFEPYRHPGILGATPLKRATSCYASQRGSHGYLEPR